MSVLIKGMEMPENCSECKIKGEGSDSLYTWSCPFTGMEYTKYEEENGRLDECPLVEVPKPHGRLIDTSHKVDMSFYDDEYEEHSMRTVTIEELLMVADNEVPTVIEAEGSEDE